MADLKDLEPLAKRLNAATDELNQTLQTIQERLNALGIGVEVWIDKALRESDRQDILNRDDEPTGDRECYVKELGYGRYGDGWGLLVRTRRFVEDTDQRGFRRQEWYEHDNQPQPLLRAARELRLAAVPLIPQLIDAIRNEASKVIAAVEQAKKIADSLK